MSPTLLLADPAEQHGASAGAHERGPAWTMHPSRWRVIRAVGARLVPCLIEATLIPTTLFYVALASTRQLLWALVVGLGWSYSAVVRRLISRRSVPALLVLTSLGITVRTIVYVLSHNSFVYFAQPILATLATSIVFGASALVGRPLIARFAQDFCDLTTDVHERPAIRALFWRLTYLWAAVNLTSALVSLTLLVSLPVAAFVGTRTVSTWLLTTIGVVLTVWEAVRVARKEGLATAIGPNGALCAYVAHEHGDERADLAVATVGQAA